MRYIHVSATIDWKPNILRGEGESAFMPVVPRPGKTFNDGRNADKRARRARRLKGPEKTQKGTKNRMRGPERPKAPRGFAQRVARGVGGHGYSVTGRLLAVPFEMHFMGQV